MPQLPGVRRTPWYARELWGALAGLGSVFPAVVALGKAIHENSLTFVPWLIAAVVLGSIHFVLRVAQAKWKDTKLANEETPLDLSACLHVIFATLMNAKGYTDRGQFAKKCRVTIHRVLDDETLEQAVPYVGGEGGGAGRTFPLRFGIIGRVALSGEPFYATRQSTNYDEFATEMAREWGISKEEARALTADRWSWMGVPILNDKTGKTIGVVYLDSPEPDFFDDDACLSAVLSGCEGLTRYVALHRT